MDICYLKGVGQKRAQQLAKLHINTVQDLLNFYPKDYIDFTMPYPVLSAPFDVKCVVKASVYGKTSHRLKGGAQLFKVMCADETGALTINFFNNPYAPKKLIENEEYYFFGKVYGNFNTREMSNPIVLDAQHAKNEPFMPIYRLTQGITGAYLSKCVKTALNNSDELAETLPQTILQEYKLLSKEQALRLIHFPQNIEDVQKARRRLIFEELLALQLGLLIMRGRNFMQKSTNFMLENCNLDDFFKSLPFSPTGAQMRSINEITHNFKSNTPMNRLLQGDVGSGKTLVAAAAIAIMAQNGYQSVLMVPTEILALQHFETLQKMLNLHGINTVLLTANVKGKAKTEVLHQIKNGEAQLVVGTHAILSDGVDFNNLALCITDEQHRFGVRQRAKLSAKAQNPHVLVMSATPIPRTLALLMFSDLDISILDEMPPGRTKVKTYAITTKKRADMYGFINSELEKGTQAYIVCPLIEQAEDDDKPEKAEMQAVTTYYEQIAKPHLPNFEIGLMHGRLKAAQKAQIMQDFAQNKVQVLVSTTVIEVGVDVKNANIIVIENAEMYGLSALHQLRGRVGRGSLASHCILISNNTNEKTKERLKFLCDTSNGFEIAKYDLENRGPGDFFGNRQHGLPTLKIANLMTDTNVLYAAQKQAQNIIQSDKTLESPENANLKKLVQALFSKETALN